MANMGYNTSNISKTKRTMEMDFIGKMVRLKSELINSMEEYKNGNLTKLQFELILRGAKDMVVNSGFCFKYDNEIDEETDEVVEMDNWTKECIADALTDQIECFVEGNGVQLNIGSGSFLIAFVGEQIWYNY